MKKFTWLQNQTTYLLGILEYVRIEWGKMFHLIQLFPPKANKEIVLSWDKQWGTHFTISLRNNLHIKWCYYMPHDYVIWW
jgi:hypothetical protein